MLSLKNKIVLITGTTSGIGQACAEQFAAMGAHLILVSRRIHELEKFAQTLKEKYAINIYPIQLDVREAIKVQETLTTLPEYWQNITILVNNAGVAAPPAKIQEGDVTAWDIMIDTNIKGLLYTTRQVLPGMIARNSGHIINIGSATGHDYMPRGNVYSATKHAVKAINKSLRIDLLGTPIRVSSVDPGSTQTSFRPAQFYRGFTPLMAQDVADAVLYCATRPLHVNVENMLVFATDQASLNHLNRRGENKGILE